MKTNCNKYLTIATAVAGLMIGAFASAQNSLGNNMLNGNNPQGQAYPQQTQPSGMQDPARGSGTYGQAPQYPNNGGGGYGPRPQNPNIGGGGYGPGPNPAYVPGQHPGYVPGGQAVGANELQDFGVRAIKQLHNGPFHGPTPTSIPGGRVITTQQLSTMAQQNSGNVLIFDVLGGPAKLPNAIPAVLAAQPGSFNDNIQQQFSQYLKQASNNDVNKALVFYCQSVQCWMSYNAALRAINLGYRNVFWYRGGIEAWQRSGLQTASTQAQGWQR